MKKVLIPTILAVSFIILISACKKDGDQNNPFIIMNPPNPLIWAQDLPYADPGAEAYDVTESGDTINITSRLQTTENVDVTTPGDYTVRYNVSDEAGNNAEEQVREVRVVLTK
jgi:hypothetical protein